MAGPLEPDWTANVLVGQVVGALDVVVIGEYQDGLLGVVVGTGKGDELLALIGNGVGGEDGGDLAVLQGRTHACRGYLGDLDLVLAQNVVGQELCDTGIEAAGLTVFLVEEGEKRRGLNAADLKDAGVATAVAQVLAAMASSSTLGPLSAEACRMP